MGFKPKKRAAFIILTNKKNTYLGRSSVHIKRESKNFRQSIIKLLKHDAADIIECNGFEETISDLENRMNVPQQKTEDKLRSGILNQTGAKNSMMLEDEVFNNLFCFSDIKF